MRLQSSGPGREQRMCSGCGSEARGQIKVGVGVEPALQKMAPTNMVFISAVEFIILSLESPEENPNRSGIISPSDCHSCT